MPSDPKGWPTLGQLQRQTVPQLVATYEHVLGEPTNARNRVWLIRRIAWRIQAQTSGGISARLRERALRLADPNGLRSLPPASQADELRVHEPPPEPDPEPEKPTDRRLPPPGNLITRNYKDRQLVVKVLSNGFEFEGQFFRSLSAIAKAVTGSHCNGFAFFQLGAVPNEH